MVDRLLIRCGSSRGFRYPRRHSEIFQGLISCNTIPNYYYAVAEKLRVCLIQGDYRLVICIIVPYYQKV